MSTSTTTPPAVQALLDNGWTRDSAEAHVGRFCDRLLCTGPHPEDLHHSLAIGLLRAWLDHQAATSPSTAHTTSTFLLGMVEATFRVGIGRTPAEVALCIRETVEAAPVRPLPSVASKARMAEVRLWDTNTASDLAWNLAAL